MNEGRWILVTALGLRVAVNVENVTCVSAKVQESISMVAVRPTDSDFLPKKRALSYIPDENGEPLAKPFWYRGRVYEVEPGDFCSRGERR